MSRMSSLSNGQTEINIAGKELVLKCNINCLEKIERVFAGQQKIRQALIDQNFDAHTTVILAGSGLMDAPARRLRNALYENGIPVELTLSLLLFIEMLYNGGRPIEVKDDDETQEASGSEENDIGGSDTGNV